MNNDIELDEERRRFLTSVLATSLAVGLSGCRTFDPAKPIPDLSPEQMLIDCHCHVFNAADLPVKGFVEFVVLGQVNIPGVAKLSGLLVNAIAGALAPGFVQERERLKAMLDNKASFVQETDNWKAEDTKREESYISRINSELDAMESGMKVRSLSTDEEDLLNAIKAEIGVSDIKNLGIFDWYRRLVEAGKTIGRYLLWGYKMTRYRYQQIEDIKQIYPEIKLFTPALIDFDHWFEADVDDKAISNKGARVSIEQQMELMVLLNRLFKGSVHPFVAFDPRRDVENGGKTLDDVKRYIESYGAVGVKLYPPMGFRPIGNSELRFCNSTIPDFGRKLDNSLTALYDYCESKQVPIMAHSANSNTNWRCKDYEGRGNPEYWKSVLTRFEKLKVNFSHFVTKEQPGEGWNRTIRELIIQFDNVYTDLSHIEKLTKEKYTKTFFTGLKEFVSHEQSSMSIKLKSRLLYGSDWIMLEKEKISRNYLRHMINQFDTYIPEARNQFIGENAVGFLGLSKGNQARDRLISFYLKQKMAMPDWIYQIN